MYRNISLKKSFLLLQNLRKNKNIVIQKSDKGNSVEVVNIKDYLDKMENLLNDTRIFEKTNLKDHGILNFAINQDTRVGNILKKLLRVIAYLKKQGDLLNRLHRTILRLSHLFQIS